MANQNRFSGPVTVFHGRPLPEQATPVGYGALIDAFSLHAPLPRTLSAISERHRVRLDAGWRILTPRHVPSPNLEGHLTFALKYEGLDLVVLKRLFAVVGPAPIEGLVQAQPTGRYARRLWFLYEWLTNTQLTLPDAEQGSYVLAVDPDQQFAGPSVMSSRHRVKNNLPGTPSFCPLVFRTEALNAFVGLDLLARARDVVAHVPTSVLSRAAAFLLLKDTRSSFAIEGEHPPQDRLQRWGKAIGEAGRHPVTLDELLRLQKIVIGDARFVTLGLRQAGGFVGAHDRETQHPIPDHISAKPEDLRALIDGMATFDNGPAKALDAVIAAASLAFGFVYVHPFEDGNGRIHRYLIHHVLAQHGLTPSGVTFPVSAVILERIDAYRQVLEDYSQRLLPLIEWEPTQNGNIQVHNDTADFYRFFDATPHAEFLYECVRKTINEDLPEEANFLERYDRFRGRIEGIVDMPERTMDLLFRFLHQNGGVFSKRAREAEFANLTDQEAAQAEAAYEAVFQAS